MQRFTFLVFLVFIVSNAVSAFAQDELHKAVDRRYRFSKKLQSEFSINGGDFLGDETHNSWSVGAKYFLHLNNTFAVGASYLYTPIYTDWGGAFGRSVTNKNQHLIDGEVMISNDAAFRAGNSVVECDFYLTLGMGTLWINRHYEPVGIVGGGLKIYTGWPWFAVRVDVNNYIHPTPNPAGDTINADMGFSAGVSFLFPVRRVKEEGDVKS